MRGGRDKKHFHDEQALTCELWRRCGQSPHHPKGAATLYHRLQNGTQCLDMKSKRRCREFHLKGRDGAGEPVERKPDVHHADQIWLVAVRLAFRADIASILPVQDRWPY